MAVNRWENNVVAPAVLSVLILELLASAATLHAPATVLAAMEAPRTLPRPLTGLGDKVQERLHIVRTLAWLERHPTLFLPLADGAPPSSRLPPPWLMASRSEADAETLGAPPRGEPLGAAPVHAGRIAGGVRRTRAAR